MRTEQIGDCTLYLGDCLEILPTLGKVDAVVTDPPYGIGKAEWDKYLPIDWYFISREIAITIYTMPGLWGLPVFIRIVGSDYRDTISLWLSNGMTHGPCGFGNWIPVVVSQKVKTPIGGQNAYRVIVDPSENIDHPDPKPLDGMIKLLNQHGGNLILDPFMGSGTTGVACVRLDRKFIGIEIEPKYFDIACRRIENEYKQPKLFTEPEPEYRQPDLIGGDDG